MFDCKKMDNRDNWNKYQGALINKLPPHMQSYVSPKLIRDMIESEKAYFARWTSDFDCTEKTQWWYCIKDEPISLESLTSKQRYRVKKGLSKTTIKLLTKDQVKDYVSDMYDVSVDCFKDYPIQYRPSLNKAEYVDEILKKREDQHIWICIDNETDKVCGWCECILNKDTVSLVSVKIMPRFLNNEVNAALGYCICQHYINELKLRYVTDGQRNIKHQTNYQDFLVKVLGFRYAYCKLNIIYHPLLKFIVDLLYPFRYIISKMTSIHPFIYNIFCILKQEEIRKSFK